MRHRAERTGALDDRLYLANENDLERALAHIEAIKPELVIVDSLQTMQATGVEGVAGGVTQTRSVTSTLTTFAKASGTPVIAIGHVTKEGNVAGRTIEHLVDVVLNFEGDKHSSLRFLRGIKTASVQRMRSAASNKPHTEFAKSATLQDYSCITVLSPLRALPSPLPWTAGAPW